jgi:hypothetical protein
VRGQQPCSPAPKTLRGLNTLGVAVALNAGAALVYSSRVFDALAAFEKQ